MACRLSFCQKFSHWGAEAGSLYASYAQDDLGELPGFLSGDPGMIDVPRSGHPHVGVEKKIRRRTDRRIAEDYEQVLAARCDLGNNASHDRVPSEHTRHLRHGRVEPRDRFSLQDTAQNGGRPVDGVAFRHRIASGLTKILQTQDAKNGTGMIYPQITQRGLAPATKTADYLDPQITVL
jgi:hypothetical protein